MSQEELEAAANAARRDKKTWNDFRNEHLDILAECSPGYMQHLQFIVAGRMPRIVGEPSDDSVMFTGIEQNSKEDE